MTDPYGIDAAQRVLDAALEAREADLVRAVLEDGWRHEDAAQVFGVSRQRVGQIMARHVTRYVSSLTPTTPAQRLREARESYRLAVHAQNLRCEAATGLNSAEVRAFYGDENESQGDVTEQRLSWRAFLTEYQATNRESAA